MVSGLRNTESLECRDMAAKKRKVYWTPERIRELIAASGCGTQAEFAALIRISPQLLSDWLAERAMPMSYMEFGLDCLAQRVGIPNSETE